MFKCISVIENNGDGPIIWLRGFTDEVLAERMWKQVTNKYGNRKKLKIIMEKNGKMVKIFNEK